MTGLDLKNLGSNQMQMKVGGSNLIGWDFGQIELNSMDPKIQQVDSKLKKKMFQI